MENIFEDSNADKVKQYAAVNPEDAYQRAGHTGGLNKQGGNLVGLCPLHPDTDPSFKISLTGDAAGCFKCFGCDAGGSIIDFVKQLEHLSTDSEAIQRTAELLDVPRATPARKKTPTPKTAAPSKPLSVKIAESYHNVLLAERNRKHLERFRQARGLSRAIIERAQIGFDGDRFTIPVYDETDKLVDIRKYLLNCPRNKPRMLAWAKGRGETRIYGWSGVKDEPVIVLTEGELDALALLDRGIPAFSVTNGAGKWPDDPPDLAGKTIHICGDNNGAGERMKTDLPPKVYAAGAEQVFIVTLPPDTPSGYDVTDYFLDGGTADGFRGLMKRAKAVDHLVTTPAEADKAEPVQAEQLIRIAEAKCTELFMDKRNQPFVRLAQGNHLEIWPVKSPRFRAWLASEFRKANDKPPSNNALASAVLGIYAICADKPARELYNRVAFHEGALWYDLSNDDWQAVRITADGWEIEDDPPGLFCRYAHQQPQVMPAKGGSVADILPFLNLPIDKDLDLLIQAYVVSSFLPDIPHPILNLAGDQGGAKSSMMRTIRAVVDPSVIPTISPPRNGREAILQLQHNWVAYFDNITEMPDWFSNILCRAATGTGHSEREYYTNEGDILFVYKRVPGINGIVNPANRADFLDRCIIINLEHIPDGKRRTERDLQAAFAKVLPGILGACFDALSHAIKVFPPKLPAFPRMADFAEWGAVIAEGLGHTQQQFIDSYQANIAELNVLALETQPFAQAVIELARESGKTGWMGTATQLLADAERIAEDMQISTEQQAWPTSPQQASIKLAEGKVNIGGAGVTVTRAARRKIILNLEE